jgi:hypothetical protein
MKAICGGTLQELSFQEVYASVESSPQFTTVTDMHIQAQTDTAYHNADLKMF